MFQIFGYVRNWNMAYWVREVGSKKRASQATIQKRNPSSLQYSNPYAPLRGEDIPNSMVKIPTPNNALLAQPPLVAPFAQLATSTPTAIAGAASSPTLAPTHPVVRPLGALPRSAGPAWPWVIAFVILCVGFVALGGYLLVVMRKRRSI